MNTSTSTSTAGEIVKQDISRQATVGEANDLLARLGIPLLFRSARVAHFQAGDFRTGQRVLDPRARKRQRNVLVVGANGTGKSYLAAALAGEWKARWARVADLLTRVRRTFKPQVEESEHSILEDLSQLRALVLDDLTATTLREFGLAFVLQLLNRRIEDGRTTIVTSHHKLAAIDALDSALASRLAGFDRVELGGPDRRLRRPRAPGVAG